jgi:MFS family permease
LTTNPATSAWNSREPAASDAEESPAESAAGRTADARVNQLVVLASKPELLSIIVARSLAAVALIGFFTYISIIVVSFADGTPQQAGMAVAINSLAFATTASQVGRLSVRFRTIHQLVGGTAFLGLGVSLVALSGTLWPILMGSAVLGMGVGVTLSIYRSLVTSYAPDEHRGSIVSLTEMAGRFANFLTPIGMGWAIGVTTPIVGFESAVRWVAVGAGSLAAVGGFACLLVWYTYRDVGWRIADPDV